MYNYYGELGYNGIINRHKIYALGMVSEHPLQFNMTEAQELYIRKEMDMMEQTGWVECKKIPNSKSYGFKLTAKGQAIYNYFASTLEVFDKSTYDGVMLSIRDAWKELRGNDG